MRASSVVLLPCAPASVAVARRALRDELRAAGVFDSAVRDAVLVISELLSNAILHARPLPGERLQVTWAVDGSGVEIAVSDGGSPTRPHAIKASVSSLGGRGLGIVTHLCANWGVRTNGVGLTVWARLPAPRYSGNGRTGTGRWAGLGDSGNGHFSANARGTDYASGDGIDHASSNGNGIDYASGNGNWPGLPPDSSSPGPSSASA